MSMNSVRKNIFWANDNRATKITGAMIQNDIEYGYDENSDRIFENKRILLFFQLIKKKQLISIKYYLSNDIIDHFERFLNKKFDFLRYCTLQ